MVDTPPQAQQGDELARQAGYGSADQLASEADTTMGTGGSFTEGLRARRETLSLREGQEKATTEFAGGQGLANVQAIRNAPRAYGARPSDQYSMALGASQDLRNAVTGTIERKQSEVSALMDFLTKVSTTLNTRKEMEMRKAQEDEDRKLREREIRLREQELGFKIDKATGELVKTEDVDGLETPDGEPLDDQQKADAKLSGDAAISRVASQSASAKTYLNQFKSKGERAAVAEQILKSGGWNSFTKDPSFSISALLTDKEKVALEAQTGLMVDLDSAIASFSGGDQMGGTGPLAQFLPGIVAGGKTREMRRNLETVRAQYQKAISGATVSDSEVKRLSAFLPTSAKTESQNLEDLQRLKQGIEANQKIFEASKREGITVNEAYSKYGKEIMGGDFKGTTTTTTQKTLDKNDPRVKEALAQGYTEAEIRKFLGM